MEFRERLRDEMEYQGLSANDLAELTNISKRTIDNYLKNNPQEPGVYNAQKISRSLICSFVYLLSGIEFKNTFTVTGDKLELLTSFDKLPEDDQKLIKKLVKKLNK